jgi:hypothetical protein
MAFVGLVVVGMLVSAPVIKRALVSRFKLASHRLELLSGFLL